MEDTKDVLVPTVALQDLVNRVAQGGISKNELDQFNEISIVCRDNILYISSIAPGMEITDSISIGEGLVQNVVTSVRAQTLSNIVNSVTTDFIRISFKDYPMNIWIYPHRKRGHFKVPCRREEDVLVADIAAVYKAGSTGMKKLPENFVEELKKAMRFTLKDDNRPALCSVSVGPHGIASSDGRVLYVFRDRDISDKHFLLSTLHSERMIKAVSRSGSVVEIGTSGDKILFRAGSTAILATPVSASYPDFIPILKRAEGGHAQEVDTNRFLSCVYQTLATTGNKEGMKLLEMEMLSGAIRFRSKESSGSYGESEAYYEDEAITEGKEPVTFDGDLLIKGVSRLPYEKATFVYSGSTIPALFKGGDSHVFCINPVRFG